MKINCPVCGMSIWRLRAHVKFWHKQPKPLMPVQTAAEMLVRATAREQTEENK